MKNRLALCAMVLFLLSLAFGQSSALPLTQRIALPNVDGRMDQMGIDIAGQRLLATAFDNHTLSVIDLKAGGSVNDPYRRLSPTLSRFGRRALPNALIDSQGNQVTPRFARFRALQPAADPMLVLDITA